MINQTGSTKTDINNIMLELGRQSSSDTITNSLNVSAYGELTLTVKPTVGVFEANFTHNLGYAPLFIVKLIATNSSSGDIFSFDVPEFFANYTYLSGPKSTGAYPLAPVSARVTTTDLICRWRTTPNLPGFTYDGIVIFFYMIFSRPLAK